MMLLTLLITAMREIPYSTLYQTPEAEKRCHVTYWRGRRHQNSTMQQVTDSCSTAAVHTTQRSTSLTAVSLQSCIPNSTTQHVTDSCFTAAMHTKQHNIPHHWQLFHCSHAYQTAQRSTSLTAVSLQPCIPNSTTYHVTDSCFTAVMHTKQPT